MKIEDEIKRALLAYKGRIPSAPVRIVIPEGRKFHFFNAADILYLQGDYDNVKLFMRRGKEQVIRGRLDRIAKLFEEHGFLRVQVSFLVNGRYILGLDLALIHI
ncbi:MAG: LytTR family transcriptional regulator DNA-binding domain-containing protein, partial [Lachnospiraceae bacterium]|nr:LytTR family transcriptional regulator DNA-binding domain-containing protein [Lachnospiraceae bacterium]